MWGGVFFVRLLLPVATTVLAACSVADQYSGRAVGYNVEAEQAQQQALLLNIVRASMGRPMQFTSVQTITGTASVMASGGLLTIPFGPHIAGTPNTGSLTGSVSGGPTFTVPVLDTQEFYQGILSPIPGQILDLYLNSGYPRELIFSLFVERIVMRRLDDGCSRINHTVRCELTFQNYVEEDPNYDLFQMFIEYLLNSGLRTEPAPPAKSGGAGQKSAASGDGSASSTATPALSGFTLCFAPQLEEYARYVPPISRCGSPLRLAQGGGARAKSYATSIIMPAYFVENLRKVAGQYRTRDPIKDYAHNLASFTGKHVSLTIYTRHTEGVFYYLGEIVRRQQDRRLPRYIQVRSAKGGLYPIQPCYPDADSDHPDPQHRNPCQNLFVVEASGAPAFLSVAYDGSVYAIPSDPDRAGRSYFVLDVIKQLLAINTSAKSLPAANVLSVVNAP
jgi:hypothetical protein